MNSISVMRTLILGLLLVGSAYAKEDTSTIALVGATLVDLQGENPVPDAIVLVSGEEIIALGDASSVLVPDTARVIDLNGLWLTSKQSTAIDLFK